MPASCAGVLIDSDLEDIQDEVDLLQMACCTCERGTYKVVEENKVDFRGGGNRVGMRKVYFYSYDDEMININPKSLDIFPCIHSLFFQSSPLSMLSFVEPSPCNSFVSLSKAVMSYHVKTQRHEMISYDTYIKTQNYPEPFQIHRNPSRRKNLPFRNK